MLHSLDSGRGSHTAESKRDKASRAFPTEQIKVFTDTHGHARAHTHTHAHTRRTYEKQAINGREALNTHTP